MKRLWLIIGGLLLAVLGGGYVLLVGQFDTLKGAMTTAVEKATGKPLVLTSQPRLQIFPKLGLDIGGAVWGDLGKDDMAVSIRGAVVRVDLFELLQRRIVISAVNLDGLHVVLRSAPPVSPGLAPPALPNVAGVLNEVQSVPLAPDAPSSTAASSPSHFWQQLRLDEVVVNDGMVELSDPQGNLRLSGLQIRIEDLAQGVAGRVDVEARVLVRQPHGSLDQDIEADVLLKTRIEPQYPVLQVLEMQGSVTPVKGLPVNKPVQLTGRGVVDVAVGSVSDVDLTVALVGSTLRLTGHGSQTGRGSQAGFAGEGTLEAQGVLRDLLTACSVAYTPRDASLLGAYQAQARVRFDKAGVRPGIVVEGVKGTLDATTFSGQGQADWPNPIAGDLASSLAGSIQLDRVAVDGYLPAASAPAASAGSRAPAAPAGTTAAPSGSVPTVPAVPGSVWPEVHVTLAVGDLRIAGLSATTVQNAMTGRGGRYTLESTASLFGSAARFVVGLDLVSQRTTLKSVMDGLDAKPLFMSVAGLDGISGRLNLRSDLTAQGADQAAWRRSLGGTVLLTGKLDVDTRQLPKDWSRAVGTHRIVSMDKIIMTAKAERGNVVLNPLTATGKVIAIQGQGQINLPTDALDLRLNTTLAGLPLPLMVRGTLAQPIFSIDAADIIQNLLNPSKEGGKQLQDGVKNLLRGLR